MRHIPGIIVQGRYDFVCPIAVSDLFCLVMLFSYHSAVVN